VENMKMKRLKIMVCSMLGASVLAFPVIVSAQTTETLAEIGQVSAKTYGLQKITAVTKVYGDGEKIAAAILEYPDALLPGAVKAEDFLAENQSIAKVYVNNQPKIGAAGKIGRYVILEFTHKNSLHDGDLSQKSALEKKRTEKDRGQSGEISVTFEKADRPLSNLSVQIRQVNPLSDINGNTCSPTDFVTASSVEEPDIAHFQQYEFYDKQVGAIMPYNLYLPQDYTPQKQYPLLFFVADASANNNRVTTPLSQGNGATIWASPAEQAKHQCIVLAPQYTQELVKKLGMMTTDENVWTPGLTLITDLLQDVIGRYSVDRDRIYGAGQSQGGMTNIAISDRYPDLFAAQWLVACQWNTAEMAALKDKHLWITVCEGDAKAFPGMNAATDLWKSLGSKVRKNDEFWDSHAPMTEINAKVRKMAAEKYPINYTIFAGGNHMYTWSFAYDIEAIRDWLFQQTKNAPKIKTEHSVLTDAVFASGLKAYQEKDYVKALQDLQIAAGRGHMKAPRYLGLCYEYGYGVDKNLQTAALYYSQAMERGDITGTYYLGQLYEQGKGVAQDYAKAMDLYLKSAQRGDIIAAPAMLAIARLYEQGLGVAKDAQQARKWQEKANALQINR